MDNEKRLAIAKARFEPLMNGDTEPSIGDLAERFNISRNAVQPAIREAFRLRLIEVRVVDSDSRLLDEADYRVQSIEDELRSRFSVSSAIVVKTDEKTSDLVHRDLGYAMSREFHLLVRDGSVIGLGSGRGPYYAVTGLIRRPRIKARNVTLMSLTGAIFPKAHSETLNAILDADYHTVLMGICFTEPLKSQRVIAYPITAQEVRTKTWLAGSQFRSHLPTLALVGLGVLRGQHKLAEVANSNQPSGGLGPILKDLKKLISISERYSDDRYCCIADICHHLFFVDPPADIAIARPDRKTMDALIAGINERLLTLDENQIRRLGGLCIVAGTYQKKWAIREVLKRCSEGQLKIQTICIDEKTASELIR